MTSQPRDKTRDSTKHDTAKFGIDLYNVYILLDLSSDPLKYWQEKHAQYPWLANMVRKYHSPPPSSASAERLFSSAKHGLAMKPKNMKQICS